MRYKKLYTFVIHRVPGKPFKISIWADDMYYAAAEIMKVFDHELAGMTLEATDRKRVYEIF